MFGLGHLDFGRFWTHLGHYKLQIALILDWSWTSAYSSPKHQVRKAATEVTKRR
jgi:L-ribulose-5-phosphate 3-epimerase UlaE